MSFLIKCTLYKVMNKKINYSPQHIELSDVVLVEIPNTRRSKLAIFPAHAYKHYIAKTLISWRLIQAQSTMSSDLRAWQLMLNYSLRLVLTSSIGFELLCLCHTMR